MPSRDAVRLQSLFASALELTLEAREAFIEQACAGEPDLLRELRGLLAADAKLADMTARPVSAELRQMLASSGPQASLTGLRVGAFELREELGRGGMGTVYRGERVDGTVTQKVAIKFVRRELLDANTLKRFQLERQLMATLDHPNIARLIDASELADGTPYYVMEYVAGVPITEYCERERLGVRERIELMRKVCGAVAEAHRELIVHRDLKPGNILIGAGGVAKLLDFGIAKPLSAVAGTAVHEETGTAQRYFSPQYAAPEQLSGAPVGVACDVYALGLLLYELLAGARPFEVSQLSAGQIERLILETPPSAPSAALARSAESGTGIRPRQLQGDLDGIVLRCLRKAPHERYASVERLEADLGNYLDGRPVQARGGHGWYRAQKFVRRNLAAVTATALVAVALVVGVIAFAWQAQIAKQRAAELEQVSKFQAEMLGQVDPNQAGVLLTDDVTAKLDAALAKAGVTAAERAAKAAAFAALWADVNATDAARDLIDRTILKPAAEAIDKQFAGQPVVDAALRQVLADRYREMTLYDAALPLQERALAIRRHALGEEHPDTLASIHGMGELLHDEGKLDEAESYYREALGKRRRVLGEAHPDTLISINNMGVLLGDKGKLGEAELYYREALEKYRRVMGEEYPDTLTSLNNMGRLLQDQGKLGEAEPYFREALEKYRRVLGNEHPDTLTSINSMGTVLVGQGKLSEAEPFFREALETRRRAMGEEHKGTLASINNLGFLLQKQGKLSAAEPYYRELVEKSRRVLGEDHPNTLIYSNNMGSLLLAQGKHAESAALLAAAETATREAFDGDNAFRLAKLLTNLGQARAGLAQFAAAEKVLLEAHAIFEQTPGPIAKDTRDCTQAIVDLYTAWDKAESHRGHDTKAAQWTRKLDEPSAATSAR